ncbi:hypothetical protein Tco_0543818 [Tanacetum coccineum]
MNPAELTIKLIQTQPRSDMSADVARGHGDNGGGDDRSPSHQVPTGYGGCLGNRGKGTRKPNLGGKKAVNHCGLWANTSGELVKDVVMPLTLLGPGPAERKAGVLAKIGTQFDLKPHMEFERWPKIYTGIQKHLQKIYNGNKSALKAQHWVQNPRPGLTTWRPSDADVPQTFP